MAKNYAKFVPPKSRSSRKKKWRTEVVVAVFLLCGGVIAFGSFLYFESAQSVVTSNASQPSAWAKLMGLIHHKKTNPIDPRLANNKKAVAANSDQPPGVHFDFYNELPNMQMPSDEQASANNTAPSPQPKAVAPVPVAESTAALPQPTVTEVAPAATTIAAGPPDAAIAVSATSPVTVEPALPKPAVVAKTSAPKPPAAIFNPEEVSDLLAAEHGIQRYVIQLGVFQSEAAANRLREAIVSVGFDASIVKVMQGSHRVYHVQEGPYDSAALAKVSQQRLEKRGIISVIQKVSA